MITKEKNYTISGELLQNIIKYLGNKPFNEVGLALPELLRLPEITEAEAEATPE